MDTWQKLMKMGNQCFVEKHWKQALFHYNQAVTLLEFEIIKASESIRILVQGLVCGYHNISSTYEQQGRLKLSRDALVMPYCSLILLSNNELVSIETRMSAARARSLTLPALLEFANKYPNESQYIQNIIQQNEIHSFREHLQH